MKVLITTLLSLALTLGSVPLQAAVPAAKIKDISDFEGMRSNMLIGYGLIVGLAGTGDSVSSIPFTRQTLVNMLDRLGVNSRTDADSVNPDNIAAVMVTANMPSLARQGSKLDITISSLGDAESLKGGMLLATPLVGADGKTYAVAQGAIVVGGFTATGADGSTITENHTTVGRIANGATVEQETGFELADLGTNLRLILREPDFTTADRMQRAINGSIKGVTARATDLGTIDIAFNSTNPQLVSAINKIQNLKVTPATNARVVIDEKTGTIVMGEDVKIADVAISHANLTINISEEVQVSQPFSFNVAGETVAVPSSRIEVAENSDPNHGKFKIVGGTSLSSLVQGLNALGIQPRDIISILQNIKAAGAIQAELVVL